MLTNFLIGAVVVVAVIGLLLGGLYTIMRASINYYFHTKANTK